MSLISNVFLPWFLARYFCVAVVSGTALIIFLSVLITVQKPANFRMLALYPATWQSSLALSSVQSRFPSVHRSCHQQKGELGCFPSVLSLTHSQLLLSKRRQPRPVPLTGGVRPFPLAGAVTYMSAPGARTAVR